MNFQSIATLVGAVLLVSLIGYTLYTMDRVPASKYAALESACTSEKASLLTQLAEAKSQSSTLGYANSECTKAKSSLELLLAQEREKNAVLSGEHDVLANARKITANITQYGLLKEYYLDALGPGKVPSQAKLRKITSQAEAIGDAGAISRWNAVLSCTATIECSNAKLNFTSYIDAQVAALSAQAVAAIKE